MTTVPRTPCKTLLPFVRSSAARTEDGRMEVVLTVVAVVVWLAWEWVTAPPDGFEE